MNKLTIVRKVYKFKMVILFVLVCLFLLIFKQDTPKEKKTSNPLDEDKAKEIANSLFIAMNEIGTDEAVILEKLQLLDLDSYAQVSNAFGHKRWVNWLGTGGLSYFPWDPKISLMGWFDKELTISDKQKIQENISFSLF